MKRIAFGAVFLLLLTATVPAARAEDGTGFHAGIKMWLNQWHQSRPFGVSTSSDTTMLFGPAIEAKFGEHIFLEASFLFTPSDYSFFDAGSTFTISRQDADLAVGYLVVPEFGLFVGYKNSALKENATGIKDTLSGPTIGISTKAPVNEPLSFYGKLAWLFTRFEQQDAGTVFREDSPGWTIEFGVQFAFTRAFTGTFGYRYETNSGKVSDVTDSFSGVLFGAMVTF